MVGSSNNDPQKKHRQPSFPEQSQEAPGLDSKLSPQADWGVESYRASNKLKNKTALVTGGDSGIGRAVCIAYAKEGCTNIVINYLNEDSDAKDTKKMIESCSSTKVTLIPKDISSDKACKELVEETIKVISQIDILVLNAAYQGKALKHPFDLDYDRVSHTFHTNIIAMFAIAKYCHPHMKRGSSIITTSSIQAYQPSASLIDYATTKGAIVGFTKALGPELIKEGIRVNSVAPGPIFTPLIPASFPPDKVSEFGKQSPIGRPGQPVELSPAYVFLASDESSYIVSEIIGVTGGSPLS